VAKGETKKQAGYSCRPATSLIGDYLAGSLEPRDQAALEAHLGGCPDCAAFLRTYKKTIDVTRAFLKLQAPKAGSQWLKFRARREPSVTAVIFLDASSFL
jgi:anti-sigma factor RsiW